MKARRINHVRNRLPPSRFSPLRLEEYPARRGFRACPRTRCRLRSCSCHDGSRSHNWAVGGRSRKRGPRSGYRCRRSARDSFRHAS